MLLLLILMTMLYILITFYLPPLLVAIVQVNFSYSVPSPLSTSTCSRRELLTTSDTGTLQARCRSCHPTNSVRALKETQSTDLLQWPGLSVGNRLKMQVWRMWEWISLHQTAGLENVRQASMDRHVILTRLTRTSKVKQC